MAASMKSFVSLFLLVGLLTLLTVSASGLGEEVEVTFIVPQRLLYPGVLKIVGNSTEFGNSNAHSAPVMTLTPRDVWVLTVTLTRGETYEVNVVVLPQSAFFDCYCRPTEPRVITVPSKGEYHVEVFTGYECNNIPCPLVSESDMFDPIRRVV